MSGPDLDHPICTCHDSMWLIQCSVDGVIVDEQLVDTDLPNSLDSVETIKAAHMALVEQAQTTWRVKMSCPSCRAGDFSDKDYGHKTFGPGEKPQMLHILSRAESGDEDGRRGPIFVAMCGCRCVATPLTHHRMQDTDFEHVPYCFECHVNEKSD